MTSFSLNGDFYICESSEVYEEKSSYILLRVKARFNDTREIIPAFEQSCEAACKSKKS